MNKEYKIGTILYDQHKSSITLCFNKIERGNFVLIKFTCPSEFRNAIESAGIATQFSPSPNEQDMTVTTTTPNYYSSSLYHPYPVSIEVLLQHFNRFFEYFRKVGGWSIQVNERV